MGEFVLSGPGKEKEVISQSATTTTTTTIIIGRKAYFAGLDRNRSRSVGFMEGKDTIQLLKQHEEGRGHSTGHHLNTRYQPKEEVRRKVEKKKKNNREKPGSQSLLNSIDSSLKNRRINGGSGGGVENKHRGVRREN